MTNSSIIKELFEYINKNVHTNTLKITDETMLFRDGIIDSMGFILLIEYLEGKYNIKANDEDLVEENFESVKAIEHFIMRKRSS